MNTMLETNEAAVAHASKRLARLVAVQTLYRASYEQETPEAATKDMLAQAPFFLNDDDSCGAGGHCVPVQGAAEPALVAAIVAGVGKHKGDLMEMLRGALDPRMTPERMEILLRHILLAGVFELHHHPDVASGIIINDYVDVARAFYGAKEPGLVNAVLDKIAKTLR